MTGALVATASAWPVRESACNEDASTSMSELRPEEGKLPPRLAALKLLGARMEWARRRTPPSIRVQSPAQEIEDRGEVMEEEARRGQASCRECS